MYNFYYMLTFYMFLISCFLLFYFYKHLLMILISFEFIMVVIFFNLYIIMIMLEVNFYILMLFLVIVACEGALGLSLIILIVRFYGNDYLNSLSFLKW